MRLYNTSFAVADKTWGAEALARESNPPIGAGNQQSSAAERHPSALSPQDAEAEYVAPALTWFAYRSLDGGAGLTSASLVTSLDNDFYFFARLFTRQSRGQIFHADVARETHVPCARKRLTRSSRIPPSAP